MTCKCTVFLLSFVFFFYLSSPRCLFIYTFFFGAHTNTDRDAQLFLLFRPASPAYCRVCHWSQMSRIELSRRIPQDRNGQLAQQRWALIRRKTCSAAGALTRWDSLKSRSVFPFSFLFAPWSSSAVLPPAAGGRMSASLLTNEPASASSFSYLYTARMEWVVCKGIYGLVCLFSLFACKVDAGGIEFRDGSSPSIPFRSICLLCATASSSRPSPVNGWKSKKRRRKLKEKKRMYVLISPVQVKRMNAQYPGIADHPWRAIQPHPLLLSFLL